MLTVLAISLLDDVVILQMHFVDLHRNLGELAHGLVPTVTGDVGDRRRVKVRYIGAFQHHRVHFPGIWVLGLAEDQRGPPKGQKAEQRRPSHLSLTTTSNSRVSELSF